MKTLYVMCGASGSGKTTKSKQLAKAYNAIRWSGDETGLRPKKLIPLAVESFHTNDVVVVDLLCTKLKVRKRILDTIKDVDCKKNLIFMNTSLEECIRRNLLKDVPLHQFMIEDIYNSLEYPTIDEGWDEIYVVEGGNAQ